MKKSKWAKKYKMNYLERKESPGNLVFQPRHMLTKAVIIRDKSH